MDVLAIAVHPDDETLGPGGTLLKEAAAGAKLHWAVVTSAHEADFSAAQIAQQAEQVRAVGRAYGFQSTHWLKLPTTRLDTLPLNDVVNAIRKVVQDVRPELVLVANRSDAHSDHRVTFQATTAVVKSFHMKALGVRRLLAYETISETDAAAPLPESAFLPTVHVDVTGQMERKLEILQLYASEVQPDPMPRSLSAVRALGRYRGATIGVEYAEAFMLLRELG
jgi:LmbE family N-acetylglucosaminyl deacetylase